MKLLRLTPNFENKLTKWGEKKPCFNGIFSKALYHTNKMVYE